jgi:hypothetical protein
VLGTIDTLLAQRTPGDQLNAPPQNFGHKLDMEFDELRKASSAEPIRWLKELL